MFHNVFFKTADSSFVFCIFTDQYQYLKFLFLFCYIYDP